MQFKNWYKDLSMVDYERVKRLFLTSHSYKNSLIRSFSIFSISSCFNKVLSTRVHVVIKDHRPCVYFAKACSAFRLRWTSIRSLNNQFFGVFNSLCHAKACLVFSDLSSFCHQRIHIQLFKIFHLISCVLINDCIVVHFHEF